MKIHEIARACRTTVATIRYYERIGLLDETYVKRGENGYRLYTSAAVQRVLLIKIGQQVGFTLRQMATELKDWDSGMSPSIKKDMLRHRLEVVDQQIATLRRTRHFIENEISKNC